MIKACVVGWYGTETMGDRAILDGIISTLFNIDNTVNLYIGSLYPSYTYRTLYEDRGVFENSCPNITVDVFNVKDSYYVKETVHRSDVVIFGGGPIMDIAELSLMVNVFKMARKQGVPTFIFGCGLGPLQEEKYNVVKELFDNSNMVSVRDFYSKGEIERLELYRGDIQCVGDPAIISVYNYKKQANYNRANREIAVNFRKFPKSEYKRTITFSNDMILDIITFLAEKYDKVILVPMHTYYMGGDDRQFFSEILNGIRRQNVEVKYKPQNLWELYNTYSSCGACVGMRYHSVVMQTLLNGNNVILNYTQNASNKIEGFIDYCGLSNEYENRTWNMCGEIDYKIFDSLDNSYNFVYEYPELDKCIKILEQVLK